MVDQTIRIHRSNTGGNVPSLVFGELAYNDADELLFIGDSTGSNKSMKFGTPTLSEVLTQGNGSGGTQINMETTKIINLADPTNAQDAATKAYADSISSGVDWKDTVLAATDGTSFDLSNGSDGSTVDGVSTSTGDRVLLKDQSDASENGIYVVDTPSDTSTWTRSTDMDEDSEVDGGEATFVQQGTANADKGFLVTSDSVTLGTDDIIWSQFTGLADVTAGDGLTKSGDTINAVAGDSSITMGADSFSVNVDGTNIAAGADPVHIPTSAAGDGLSGGGTGTALSVNPADFAGDGLAEDGSSPADLAVVVNDIAGTGLSTTGAGTGNDLRIGSQGDGLTGGDGSTLAVQNADSSLSVGSGGVAVNIDSTSVKNTGDSSTSPLTTTGDGFNLAIDQDSIGLDANNAIEVQNVDGGTF